MIDCTYMIKNFIKISGKNKGSTSIIIAGIHGNEKCGIDALKKIIPSLKINNGELLVGYGNPLAIKKNVRYTDVNLNRMFRPKNTLSQKELTSYEYKRAEFLKKYLDQADALLDLHASTTSQSRPFIICEKNAFEIAKYLPANIIVSGFDKIQPGGTDYYMNKHKKIGICVECGYLKNPRSEKIAKESIMNFLITRNHIDGKIKARKQKIFEVYCQYKTKTSNFSLSRKFRDFENVSKNQIIGFDGKNKIKAKKDSVILFAKNTSVINTEAFLLGEHKRV